MLVSDDVVHAHTDPTAGIQVRTFSHLKLPESVLFDIFVQLDLYSLLKCKRVCRLFNHIISHSQVLQYRIELMIYGYEDGFLCRMSVTERLKMLRRHRAAWEGLSMQARLEVMTSFRELSRLHMFKLYAGVLARLEDYRRITFTRLPSHLKEIKEQVWTVRDVDFDIYDLDMDPGQDLLVLIDPRDDGDNEVSFLIHLRNLLGEPHPANPVSPILEFTNPVPVLHFEIRVCSNYLAILCLRNSTADEQLNGEENQLLVWNWKTGDIILRVNGNRQLTAFAFLSERYLITTGTLGHTDGVQIPMLDVYDLSVRLAKGCFSAPSCVFHLPPVVPGFCKVFITSSPSPASVPSPGSSVPFFVARDHRLAVINVEVRPQTVIGTDNIARHLEFLVPVSTFIEHIHSLPEYSEQSEAVHFEWMTWGPTGSRVIVGTAASDVFGMKHVMKEVISDGDGGYILCMRARDFNFADTRLSGASESCLQDPLYDDYSMFLEPITTSLPYRESCWILGRSSDPNAVNNIRAVLTEDAYGYYLNRDMLSIVTIS